MRFVFLAVVFLFSNQGHAQAQFKDLVFAGYQGWFTVKDSHGFSWRHWGKDPGPAPGQVDFELYPDVSEYHPKDLYSTHLGDLPSGEPARLFASDRDSVVDVHVRWMKQYGIDGAALQRFLWETVIDPQLKEQRNNVAEKLRAKAEKYGVYFYLTYDISGVNPSRWVSDLKGDLEEELEGKLDLFTSPQYARQDGRPVIGLWGLGYKDRPGTPAQTIEVINYLKQKGFYVMGGVPTGWRTSNNDSKPGFLNAYLQYDMIQPWMVGSMSTDSDIQRKYNSLVRQDVNFLKNKGVSYQTVIFPGFAWSNWNGGSPNMIPRRGGNTFWRQAYWCKQLGIKPMIAMFDEYDEGTAIAKAAPSAYFTPRDQYFLTLDADGIKMSSDFYLRLAGEAIRRLKMKSAFPNRVPISYQYLK